MRIFHGTVNIAGIGGHLAAWQRREGHEARFVVYRRNRLFDNHDEAVFPPDGAPRWRLALLCFRTLLRSALRYDVFNFYGGRSFLPWGLDLPLLRLLGRKIVMTYCGSEARQCRIEAARNPFWPRVAPEFAGTPNVPEWDPRKRRMMRWHGFWCHRILAPRNLNANVRPYVPARKLVADIWVHNLSSIEFEGDAAPPKADPSGKVVLVHAPSSPRLKGTEYFRRAAAALKNEGLPVDYVELTGMPHAQVIERIAEADIVLDQLLLGGFGSLSVEGMALGRPVICYLLDDAKREHYPDCPIANATIDNVTDVLRDLVADADRRLRLGREGQAFVGRHLDYESVNRRLLDLYLGL